MAVISSTVAVTGLGVYWVRETLAETRLAVKAAEDAVAVTREIGQQQVRACIGLVNVEVHYDEATGKFIIDVVFKNSGQTPAHDVEFAYEWAAEQGEFQLVWHDNLPDGDEGTLSRGAVGVGAEMYFRTSTATPPERGLTKARCEEVMRGERNLWLYGRVRYVDAFGQKQVTCLSAATYCP